jgi:ATP-binding cassette subfamily B protein
MIRLLRTYLRPSSGQIALALVLLLVQSIGNLYLPTLNGDIINNGVARTSPMAARGRPRTRSSRLPKVRTSTTSSGP